VRTNPAKAAPAVTFQANGSVTVAGSLSLGTNNGQRSGDTPDYLAFDGINITGGCLLTLYNGASGTPQPTGLLFQNAHIQALNNSCHLVYLNSSDNVVIRNVELGPMCCDGDAVELGIPRVGAPNPSNIVLDSLYIHDIYDSCARAAAFGPCTVTGFGSGCGGCDHVDGLQAFGGTNVTVKNTRVYAINPGGPVGQGLFFQSANGGTFTNLTLQNDTVAPTPNNDVSIAGPGNSVFSGSINILNNNFLGDFSIYDWVLNGTDSRVVAAGTSISFVGNTIGYATNAKKCSVTAGNGSIITPTYSNNVFGNGVC
jgi:hypothetical protein